MDKGQTLGKGVILWKRTKQPHKEFKKQKFGLKRGIKKRHRMEISISTITEIQSKAKNSKGQHITHTFL